MAKSFTYNKTVREILAARPKVTGEVGIEIECEGSNLPGAAELPAYWVTHADGSLRGESCEYVLGTPIHRKDIVQALDVLEKVFKERKTKLNDSYRTSVHVHLNMQSVSIKQTYNTILLYGILEDILTEYAGPSRSGNLFCLRMSDAEYMLHALRESVVSDYYNELNSPHLRYAGCNVKSLFDHNSLEFRAFRGTSDMRLIAQWSDILLQVKDAALSYEHPAAIMANFSELGPDAFLDKNFTPVIAKLIKGFKDYQNRIYAGVRLVQDVAFASDWAPTPVKSSEDKAPKAVKFYNVDPEANIDRMEVNNGLEFRELMRDLARPPQQIDPAAVLRAGRAGRNIRVNIQPAADPNWPAAQEEEI